MTIRITEQEFAAYKVYARRMLDNFTQAQVAPYINNRHGGTVREAIAVWGQSVKKAMKYPQPDNVTVVADAPVPDPIDDGSYGMRSLVRRFMEHAGYRETREFSSIAAMKPGVFEVKTSTDYDKNGESMVEVIAIRANGDLAGALTSLRAMDDATLDTVARDALGKTNIIVHDATPQELAAEEAERRQNLDQIAAYVHSLRR